MDRAEFEDRARAMAETQGYVTAATLSDELGLSEADAKAQLQLMYDGGALELDLEGDDFVYRLKGQVKGTPAAEPAARPAPDELDGEGLAQLEARLEDEPDPPDSSPPDSSPPDSGPGVADELREATTDLVKHGRSAVTQAAFGALANEPGAEELEDDERKKLLWGIGLGALFPGVGLFYAAPFLSAGLATAAVLAVLGILQLIPVIGTILSLYVFGAFMLASGILGGLYTHRFNKTGRRTRLLTPREGRRALPF
jgi:hypothetical protein